MTRPCRRRRASARASRWPRLGWEGTVGRERGSRSKSGQGNRQGAHDLVATDPAGGRVRSGSARRHAAGPGASAEPAAPSEDGAAGTDEVLTPWVYDRNAEWDST